MQGDRQASNQPASHQTSRVERPTVLVGVGVGWYPRTFHNCFNAPVFRD